mmetsp:Transcript_70612/g.163222  ORF Transcript_70612/g.163222 Transcript_70612/m.163222 type:complete len:172 (+) Transcript_70612:215-730(+)
MGHSSPLQCGGWNWSTPPQWHWVNDRQAAAKYSPVDLELQEVEALHWEEDGEKDNTDKEEDNEADNSTAALRCPCGCLTLRTGTARHVLICTMTALCMSLMALEAANSCSKQSRTKATGSLGPAAKVRTPTLVWVVGTGVLVLLTVAVALLVRSALRLQREREYVPLLLCE